MWGAFRESGGGEWLSLNTTSFNVCSSLLGAGGVEGQYLKTSLSDPAAGSEAVEAGGWILNVPWSCKRDLGTFKLPGSSWSISLLSTADQQGGKLTSWH